MNMARSYDLDFKGFLIEERWTSLPKESGIYCVYAGTLTNDGKRLMWLRLLYIGEAEDIRKRVPQEPKKRRDKWEKKLTEDEILCVTFALVDEDEDRERAEAAMINHHQPPCNKEYKDSFPYPRTTIRTSGKNTDLTGKFTVYPSD